MSIKLDYVTLETLASGDPCLMPCVDCGLLTKYFCDHCWGADHFPQDKWAYGLLIPLCHSCKQVDLQCHFCRGMDWCVPAPSLSREGLVWYRHSTGDKWSITPALGLQDQGYKTEKFVKNIMTNSDKKWDPVLEEYIFPVTRSSTEAA